jgi:hypothetical protein
MEHNALIPPARRPSGRHFGSCMICIDSRWSRAGVAAATMNRGGRTSNCRRIQKVFCRFVIYPPHDDIWMAVETSGVPGPRRYLIHFLLLVLGSVFISRVIINHSSRDGSWCFSGVWFPCLISFPSRFPLAFKLHVRLDVGSLLGVSRCIFPYPFRNVH